MAIRPPRVVSGALLLCSAGLALAYLMAASLGAREQAAEPSRDAILEHAERALLAIDDDAAWVLAATELAQALHALEHPHKAMELLTRGSQRAAALGKAAKNVEALTWVAAALVEIERPAAAREVIDQARLPVNKLDGDPKRWDLHGKLAALDALSGRTSAALDAAAAMPESDETQSAYKSRTLHDIAPAQAKAGDIPAALATLEDITMGLVYYRVAATADVVIEAHGDYGETELMALLDAATVLARTQEDGYFVAGALRHLAVARHVLGKHDMADRLFAEALEGARMGASAQHRARAQSRVATSMADHGRFDGAVAALPAALAMARGEQREPFRLFALYEIAGSAAFAGDFPMARTLLDEIPADFAFGANYLRWATQRDVAWGLARHGHIEDAVALALAIEAPRERVQALSRILRVLQNPHMKALPRYL